MLLAVSDLHSRVSTLFAWGESHADATALVKEAYEMFVVENEARVMKRKPPRVVSAAPTPERRNTSVVEEPPKREGPPPGVGGQGDGKSADSTKSE